MKDLSPRQKQIADLMMQGLSNKEIAYELGLSYGAVKSTIWWMSRKLKIQTRIKIVLHLLRESGKLVD